MAKRFVFDEKRGAFVPKKPTLNSVLGAVLRYVFAVASAAVVFYTVFALVFSTERERLLEQEHQLLSEEYATLTAQLDRIEGTVGNLQVRDREIYRELFGADPSNYSIEAQDTLLRLGGELETMQESDLVWDTYALTNRVESTASQVTRWLAEIDTLLAGGSVCPTAIPSVVPVKPFSPLQTGASVGKKITPFYKTIRDHTGIDLVAPTGTLVRCTADGKVRKVVKSSKGMGNQVTVEHPGGLQTVYAHLNTIKVSEGQDIRQGDTIGTVGQSGSCFAPCLHYEVLRGGFVQEPVNYFFAQLDPATFHGMMVVALTTGQSMD